MSDIRKYIDLLNEQDGEADQPLPDTPRLCQLAGLSEGSLIPYPERILRIGGGSLDFYQLLKMTTNPNLAHKVNYKQTSTDTGANLTEVVMVFYDDISFEETKKLFDHYDITYTDEAELKSKKKSPFISTLNPPNDGDQMHR